MEKSKIMANEKIFERHKWYKSYNFRAQFGKYYSLVVGENFPDYVKYYKGNDAKRVVEDAKKIMQKEGWNYAEITDKSNEEICFINKGGFLNAYERGKKVWKLKTDAGYKSRYDKDGKINLTYSIGGL
jgi:hypothetical protein